jgi:hypothetical protein
MKHSATFAFTKGIGGIFNLLGKLTVTLLNCVVAWACLEYLP